MRSPAHFLEIARRRLERPTHAAGNVSRPVFNVVSATFNPAPSLKMMFWRGMRTSVNFTTALYSARSPMNRQRYAISSPGVSTSTMNAVICLRSFPPTIFDGVRAITTSTPAFTPLVHQSFSPVSTNSEPSAVGSAFKLSVAGSEPA